MRAYKYSATARIEALPLPDSSEIMDQLAEHILEQSSLDQALLKLRKQGVKQKYGDSLGGLEHLASQLKHLRRQELERYTLEPLIDRLNRQIQSVVSRELEALEQKLALKQQELNRKMESFLRGADEVMRKMEEIRSGKKRDTAQAQARLEKKFEQLFLQKYGLEAKTRALRDEESLHLAKLQQVPHSPSRTLDKLKDYQPIAPSTGEELASLSEQARSIAAVERAHMQSGFSGNQAVDLEDALRLVNRILKMERLEAKLKKGMLSSAEELLLAEILGAEALTHLRTIEDLCKQLVQTGYLESNGETLRLSPRAMRQIGQKALSDIFSNLGKGSLGGHEISAKGTGQPETSQTRAYNFGDSFNIHLSRTLMNALARDASRIPISLVPGDFEVYDERRSTECSNVLLLDLSYTMAQNRKLQAAKKVILALDSLIRTRFPRDTLHIVGFATYARQLTTEELPHVNLSLGNPFTNMQDGLRLADEIISRERGRNRQIIIITDGEPTAFCRDGDLYVDYPPTPEIFFETMKEVTRLTRKGIVINTFMLDERPQLVDFVEQMTRVNKGRAFFSTPHRLGEYLLVDYLARRRRLIN
jgi:uncharacterized protein with von Willebrand factor type A (vWA) domain